MIMMILRTLITRYSRLLLTGIALAIVGLILWQTRSFLEAYRAEQQSKMEIWALAQSQFMGMDPSESLGPLILKIFQSNTQTPMVLAHRDGSYSVNNLPPEVAEDTVQMNSLIDQYADENPPLVMEVDGAVLATLYWGPAPLAQQLAYYPWALLLVLLLFAGLVMIYHRSSKIAAQNKLWAGMARETAHQIATPLSALMGWSGLLKAQGLAPEISQEIDRDLERLHLITDRFARIGTQPTLSRVPLVAATQKAIDYLKPRWPESIELVWDIQVPEVAIMLNEPLYAWCLENLLKNAIDAMQGKGTLTVQLQKHPQGMAVRVVDHGPGIPRRAVKKIFQPGFTTKKRGWGLGLSLVHRIVVNYHKGWVRVAKTGPQGTVMELVFVSK
jgi:two-component system, sporulation sensor kinase D